MASGLPLPAPALSVLLPVYNQGATLGAALRSLVWQTDSDWEAVVVDDGSSDESLAVAREWAGRDRRIRVLAEPHLGLVEALNRGLTACRGALVARLDADDVCHPRRLERQRRRLESDAGLALVSCRVRLFPTRTLGRGFRRYERWLNSLVEPTQIVRDLFVESPLAHPSVMVRREWLERLGGYRDCGWPEDYDLWLRLWEGGASMAKVDEVLLFWREHSQRLTRQHTNYSREAIVRLKVDSLVRTYLKGRVAVVVWGAGDDGKRLARELRRQGVRVQAFADLHPRRVGQRIDGSPVISPRQHLPEVLRGDSFHLAAVGREGGRDQVRQEMSSFGLVELRDFVCVA